VRKIPSVLPIDKYGHIVTVLHQMDLSVTTPTQILGKINAHEMYMHINDKDESSSKRKDLALKANPERKGKAKVQIEEESSSDDDIDANIALMVRKTTKMLNKLNREGIKFDSRKKKFFSRRTSSRARNKMTAMMRKRKRDSSRGRMGRTRGSTKRKMERHILLVIGSLTLSHQVDLLQVKKKMMKKLPPSLGTSLHHHHRHHRLLTYASWLEVNGRYKMILILLMIVIVMRNLLHLAMMN
jgi:hypothetical protein